MDKPAGRGGRSEIPFPQADNPFKVIDVIGIVADCKTADDETLADFMDMVSRQGAYYGNAAAFLGYIKMIGGWWRLTKQGESFQQLTSSQRTRALADTILALPVFEYAAEHVAIMGDVPRDKDTASIIQENDDRVNETTAMRRAKTVNSWVDMVAQTCPQAIQEIQNIINAEG